MCIDFELEAKGSLKTLDLCRSVVKILKLLHSMQWSFLQADLSSRRIQGFAFYYLCLFQKTYSRVQLPNLDAEPFKSWTFVSANLLSF